MVLQSGMKEMTVPIDQAGRIVLPKDVRQELAIEPGDTLKLSVHGCSVTLTPHKETVGFGRKGYALVFSTAGEGKLGQETVNGLLGEIRAERHEHSLAGLRGSKRQG
jgi:AbrB family looped-hinge helix DNA binding protein